MTSVERARKFIQAKGKAIALTIVPLATLTVAATQPAKALTLQPLAFSGGTCNISGNGFQQPFANACFDTPGVALQSNGLNSIKLTGNASEEPFPRQLPEQGIGDQIGFSLTFSMTGSASGNFTGTVPLSWDFTTQDSNSGATSGSYQLTFTFTGAGAPVNPLSVGGALTYTSCNGGSAVCSSMTGSSSVDFAGSITGYTVALTASVNDANGIFTLNVPQNSVDVNGAAPEPGSIALAASGLLGLMFARFRRRKV